MAIDARIPLMVQPVKSDLDRQQTLAGIAAQEQATRLRQQQFEAQQQQAQREAEQQQLEQQREQAGMIARLTRGVTDEGTYQQARQAARTRLLREIRTLAVAAVEALEAGDLDAVRANLTTIATRGDK